METTRTTKNANGRERQGKKGKNKLGKERKLIAIQKQMKGKAKEQPDRNERNRRGRKENGREREGQSEKERERERQKTKNERVGGRARRSAAPLESSLRHLCAKGQGQGDQLHTLSQACAKLAPPLRQTRGPGKVKGKRRKGSQRKDQKI